MSHENVPEAVYPGIISSDTVRSDSQLTALHLNIAVLKPYNISDITDLALHSSLCHAMNRISPTAFIPRNNAFRFPDVGARNSL